MTVPTRCWLAAVLGTSLLPPCFAGAVETPAPLHAVSSVPLPSPNQTMADTIAGQLRQSAHLRNFDVDVGFRDGVAEVSGVVRDEGQREEVVRIVRSVPGVQRVVDRLRVADPIQPVQAGGAPGALPPPPGGGVPPLPPRPGTGPEMVPPGAPGGLPTRVAPPGAVAVPPGGAAAPEAMPVFQAPAPAPYSLNPPRMPPYAWPTYAPYNNFSRVAYPLAYPYNSWPYIGPCYPFPKVPLGWRSVRLEWDDGFWWYSKTATRHDWWKLRYW